MEINKAYCLFEQSGTFKKEFIKLGIQAEDFDIQNEFGQTDNVVDIFAEIEKGYEGEPSIFDRMTKDDLILAFFPCTRFEVQILMGFRGELFQFANWSDVEKLEYDLKLHNELHYLYDLITKMALIVYRKGLRMIIENPYSTQHYLHNYWCLKPKLIDNDRTIRGDYYKKPTQFWFINCEPENNFIMGEFYNNSEGMASIENAHLNTKALGKGTTTVRSMIHPDYANRFIREFVLGEEFEPQEMQLGIGEFDD